MKYVQGKFKAHQEKGNIDEDLFFTFKEWLPFNNLVYGVKMFSSKQCYFGSFSLSSNQVYFGFI